MPSPEDVEQVAIAAPPRVVLHSDDLGVVGRPGADVLVGRLVEIALAVSDLGPGHPGHALEGELDAPEAASAELRELLTGRRHVVITPLRDRRRCHRRCTPAAENEP